MPYQTERLHEEYRVVRAHVPADDISALNSLDQLYAKVLVISSGSEFESLVASMMMEFGTRGALIPEITTLIQRKAVERQYFQNFDWSAKNINRFLSLFGGKVTELFDAATAAGVIPKESISDFISMNGHRNDLIHGNFAAASIDLTPEEVMAKFQSAVGLCDALEGILREVVEAAPAPGPGA